MALSYVKSVFSGRKSTSDTDLMLSHLSAEGIAKLNRDILNGVHPTQSLKELRRAFKHARKRWRALEKKVPKELLEKYHPASPSSSFPRPLTAEEMVLLAHVPTDWLENTILQTQQDKGLTLDAILEELAFEYRHQQLQWEVEALKLKHHGAPVRVSQLNPSIYNPLNSTMEEPLAPSVASTSTTSPFSLPFSTLSPPVVSSGSGVRLTVPSSPCAASFDGKGGLRIGFSPTVLWFKDRPSQISSDVTDKLAELKAEPSPVRVNNNSPPRTSSSPSPSPSSPTTTPTPSSSSWASFVSSSFQKLARKSTLPTPSTLIRPTSPTKQESSDSYTDMASGSTSESPKRPRARGPPRPPKVRFELPTPEKSSENRRLSLKSPLAPIAIPLDDFTGAAGFPLAKRTSKVEDADDGSEFGSLHSPPLDSPDSLPDSPVFLQSAPSIPPKARPSLNSGNGVPPIQCLQSQS